MLFYFINRRLINAESFRFILSSRVYYNSIRKEIPNKSKSEIIKALLLSLKKEDFIY
jgi:hypothetical protein